MMRVTFKSEPTNLRYVGIGSTRDDARSELIELITIALLDEPSPPYSWNQAEVVARRITDKLLPSPDQLASYALALQSLAEQDPHPPTDNPDNDTDLPDPDIRQGDDVRNDEIPEADTEGHDE